MARLQEASNDCVPPARSLRRPFPVRYARLWSRKDVRRLQFGQAPLQIGYACGLDRLHDKSATLAWAGPENGAAVAGRVQAEQEGEGPNGAVALAEAQPNRRSPCRSIICLAFTTVKAMASSRLA